MWPLQNFCETEVFKDHACSHAQTHTQSDKQTKQNDKNIN